MTGVMATGIPGSNSGLAPSKGTKELIQLEAELQPLSRYRV